MEYLYLIKCNDYHKIGVAKDVESRLASLQTGNPYRLEIQACFGYDNAEIVERAIHQRFKNVRGIGEWFTLSSDQLEDYRKICFALGGVAISEDGNNYASEQEIADAEEISSELEDNYRVEITRRRLKNGETVLHGTLRARGKDRKCLGYVSEEELRTTYADRLADYQRKDISDG